MGRSPQTIANGLKPYGLIYDLVRNALVPVHWAIRPDKLKDGVDFTADGKAYRGGSFIISAEFAADAIATINTWRAKGVAVDGPIESEFTAPVFKRVTGFPNVVIDDQNDGLVTPFYENAEIPSTAYRIGFPYDLGPCDDVFVMPHADPTWEDHQNLITFNQGGGFIWAACHAVSALENLDDPADPDSDPDMNFLSEHSLVLWGDHADGTPPYLYSNSEADHPIMQFMGTVDTATQNGSEQIYLPTSLGWRATTTIAAWDPDHPDIPSESPGEAAVFAYGRGFGNPGNGLVMYEAGHSLDENSPAGVAAQRAYFNFLLLGGIENESQPTITLDAPPNISCVPVDLGATISGGSPPYSSVWSNDCGGSFSDPSDPEAAFTPPAVSEETTCIIRQTVIDQCGRFNFTSTTITIENPAVSITKEVTPDSVAPGDTVTYTITVTNVGNVDAHLANIEEIALPAGFSYVAGSTSGLITDDPTISGQTLTWNGDWVVAPAGEATLSYQATAGGVPGTYPSGAATDEVCIDTIVSIEETALVTVTLNADLSLDLGVDNATPPLNDNITFTITVTNDGPNTATAVAVTDLLPSGLTYISSNPSQGSYTSATGLWDIGSVSKGGSVTLDITARVDSTVGIINTAELTASDQPDPDSTPNNHDPGEDDQAGVLINTIADLAISKSDAPDPVDADSLLTYTLSVTNNGPDDTLNIQVVDVLPVGVTFQSAAGSGWICTEDSGTVTCTRATLPNGATSPDITITVTTSAAGGSINNAASTSSAASDTSPADNSIAIDTTVNPVADLSITKTDFPDPVLKSEPLTYTLSIANNGPSAANSLTVADTLPAGVLYQSATGIGWSCSESSGTVTCTRAALSAGATAPDITILVTAPAAAGNISNTATVTAAETDPDAGNNNATANTTVTNQADLRGTIYEDRNGDGDLSDAAVRPGVTLSLYRDGGDGLANGTDDSLIGSTTTDPGGNYAFLNRTPGTYWVVVDSKTVTPSAGLIIGSDQEDVWAEQTNGPIGALCSNGNLGTNERSSPGPCFGGRRGGQSDDAASLNTAEHVAKVALAGGTSGVDFGFSFNVVTDVRGGDNGDDDGSAARTVQGSLRQFLQNANAVTGADAMRFVPAVPANAGTWWQVAVSKDLPDILDSNTTIDGTAYSLFNGSSLRDENPGWLGTGGFVGVDGQALPTLNRPEFEILDANNRNIGLDVQANSATLRRLAISGFGDAQNNDGEANIRVGAVTGTLIEECVIGAGAGSFSAPAEVDTADNIRVVGGDNGTIRNNLIGFSGGNGIGCKTSADGWVIEGNEIRGNASQNAEMNGISLEASSSTIHGNLIVDNQGAGIDTLSSTGAHTIENNTITNNGKGAVETPGVRIFGTGSTVDRNRIYNNYGAGVMVTKDAQQNTITRNSIYDNGQGPNGQIGIDLLAGGNQKAGDSPFVTLNDPGDSDTGANALLNFPILESASIVGGNLILTGFARPASAIEFFTAKIDPSGLGQGQTYLTTLTEGSGADGDGSSASYGPGPINGLNQGSDTTNRFRFEIPVPPGVFIGEWLTATATLGGSTSEFSGNVAVGPLAISGRVYEDVNGDSNPADAVGRPAVSLTIYRDGGDGQPDGSDDNLITTVTTDASGNYNFSNLGADRYWIVVDSKTIAPSAGFRAGFDLDDVWAEQTYGDNSYSSALDMAARFGGRTGGVSDNAAGAGLAGAQHVARVQLSNMDVSGVDFGFSFNVVTNTRGGDSTDDDGSADRTIQGSLRQFLQNANAIAGANALRFVPAVAANAGGDAWWQVAVTLDLPDVLDSNTTIDGTAYSLFNGTSLHDENPGLLGTGGTVGVDSLALPTVERPEFEIVDVNNRNIGLDVQAANTTIRRLAISSFGDAQNNDNEANIRVGAVTGTLIEECVIGAGAGSFSAPAEVATADNIRVVGGDNGTIRNNLIGFSGGNGIGCKSDADGWLIAGNEIRGNARQNPEMNGISLENCSGAAVRGNLIADSRGAGIDTLSSTGAHTIENNTITNNGTGAVETPGIRIFGTGSTIDHNLIYENFGAGVMVTKDATQNTITQNSIYDNGTIGAASGQIGIDLLAGGNEKAGDSPFATLNDADDADSGGNELLNFPVLETATTSAGNLILTGFARPGSAIELYIADPDPSGFGEGKTYITTLTEGSGGDSDATSGSYGPGAVNNLIQGSDTTNRFRFEISIPPGVSQGTYLTATATRSGSTSEFSGILAVDPPGIFGTVYEDPNGDAGLADGQARSNVTVALYRDGGDGQADGIDDSLVISTATNGSGNYSFSSIGNGTYWITVDSKEIVPNAGLNSSSEQRDIWAEQTYGPAGSLCADGSGGTSLHASAGACFGGRQAGVSDNASALATAQHVARVMPANLDVTGVDFGFSFNVVTNIRGGDSTDDDGSADRTIQGSLRQFLQNANAVSGANAMRFVPTVAANASGGGGVWWQVAVTLDLPDVLDVNTTIDGTAYSASDGTTVRNDNATGLGSGGTAGVDGLGLPTLDPEFEIVDSANKNIGLEIQANNTTIRRLGIYGFGDAQNNDGEANIMIGEVSGTLIEDCVIGTSAASFTAPFEMDTADNIRARKGGSGTIRNNLIGFSGGNGISVKENSVGWLIVGNEIRGNGHQNAELNGISFEKSSSMTVRANLIADSNGAGVDMKDSTGSNTFENNTITGNGSGAVETPGIRLYGTGSTIDRNVIYENFGAGVMVTKDATQNTITQNSIYDNGTAGAGSGQIGIDLLAGGNEKAGDSPFVTLNDSGDGDSGANGLLNFPVISTADIGGSGLTLTGFAPPGSVIEFFIAAPDPSGFGEGKTYIDARTEGSGDDTDATSGHYGPGAVNGLVQGEDTTNRFQFVVPVPVGVTAGTVLTATATLAGSTSEFSGNITVTGILVADILVLKSALTVSDPVNGTTNPKAIPGANVIYTIAVSNQGNAPADNDTVAITDAVPLNTSLFVGDLDGSGSPVKFINGATASGLSYMFTSLASTTDDVAFSNDDGASFTYDPGPDADADGFNSSVTHLRIGPKGVFNGASGGNNPSFEIKFKVRVE
jgi:uncharacterized repeat protein (TIGR01451 family)